MATSAKTKLRRAIEGLTEEQAEEVLDFLNLMADPDTLTLGEMARVRKGEQQIRRGEFVTLDELERKLGL